MHRVQKEKGTCIDKLLLFPGIAIANMFRFTELVYLVASWSSLAAAHTVIVYPGWRGNNIHTNGTASDTDPSIVPGSLGITYENGTYGFPYGMQWMYPCT